MSILKTILWLFFTALFAVLLELNRNTIFGWILFLILAAGSFLLLRKPFSTGKQILIGLGYPLLFILVLLLSWPPVRPVPVVNIKHPDVTTVIKTEKGAVTGVYNSDHSVEVFAGIPYAKPPVGELRWRPPQDAEVWEGVKACDTFAPMSMQTRNLPIVDSLTRIIGYHDYKISLNDNYREPASEDSLYLNIWKPAGEETNLPVIVYIHGGSLQTGQPWYDDYSGETFARNGVIVVNMGYRLGVFGFLADEALKEEDGTTGNYGLLDQIKALEWVQHNIASFGGNPENVTLVGESAGAVCVDALCVSPLAKGLFKRAILESSTLSATKPPHSFRLFDEAIVSGNDLKKRYEVSDVNELRLLPAEKLVNEMNTQHHITVDGYVLPDTPYQLRSAGIHNEEALLHGFNAEESGPFIIFSHANLSNYKEKLQAYDSETANAILELYPASTDEEADHNWALIYGAEFFNYSHYCLNRLASAQGIPVYEYLFTKTNKRLSCWHSGELVYAFGRIPELSSLYDESDRSLSGMMNQYWINFAKTGDPNGEGLPRFEENSTSVRMMELGSEVGMIEEPYLRLYDIFDRTQGLR